MPLIAKLMGGIATLLAATFFWSFAVPLTGLIVLIAKFFAG